MKSIHIERTAYSDQSLRSSFAKLEDDDFKLRWKYRFKQKIAACKSCYWTRHLKALFPILIWLTQFDVRRHLLGEIVAGLTIGFVNVPQGMAFAALTHLDPYFGLYVAFFPVLVYILMGSCHHQSWGGFGVTAIISGDAVLRIMNARAADCTMPTAVPTPTVGPFNGNVALEVSVAIALLVGIIQYLHPLWELFNWNVAREMSVATALLVGIIQCIMGFLRMGFISVYLSRSFIQGLSTGAAFHVATSQVPTILGIDIERPHGALSFFKIWIGIFSSLSSVHWATFLVTLVSLILLLMMSLANYKLKNKLPVPIPMDMIVVQEALKAHTRNPGYVDHG